MFASICQVMRKLKRSTSGNAALLVAIGLPTMIGGSGLAVDVAQWYMWKRDLQYAVDQAALAGAWTMTNTNTTVQQTYATRAQQEYDANISSVRDFDSTPVISLAQYGGSATNNSVLVTASASKKLPFSSLLTGTATTIRVSAQATFTSGKTWTACILATSPSAAKAFKFGGSVSGNTTCGVGSLSNDPTAAMFEAGNTNNDLGNLVATGGIDSSFSNNGYNRMHPNTSGLSDPYANLDPPSSAQSDNLTYACSAGTPGTPAVAGTTSTTATVKKRTIKEYSYKIGNQNNLSNYTFAPADMTAENGYLPNYDDDPGVVTNNVVVPDNVVAGTEYTTGPTTGDYIKVGSATGNKQIWRSEKVTIKVTYSNIVPKGTGAVAAVAAIPPNAALQPGIYTDISITCQTTFAPGVYFISGDLNFGKNQSVRTSGVGGVMFVLTGSTRDIIINSDSDVQLTGISKSLLMTPKYNVSESNAQLMAGTLIFDKNSTSTLTINGNSNVKLDGTIYVPNRDVKMNGNGTAASACMMVAGSTVEFIGNFNINNICTPTNANGNISIGGTTTTVKLVA